MYEMSARLLSGQEIRSFMGISSNVVYCGTKMHAISIANSRFYKFRKTERYTSGLHA